MGQNGQRLLTFATGLWTIGFVTRRALVSAPLVVLAIAVVGAQTKAPVRRRAPAAAVVKTTQEPADLTCPSPLGAGVKTKLNLCDVLTGRDPAQGILIKFPPHRGVLTLR